MKLFTVHFENDFAHQIKAEKVEFDWNTRTAVFLVNGEVIGSAVDWIFISSTEVE